MIERGFPNEGVLEISCALFYLSKYGVEINLTKKDII